MKGKKGASTKEGFGKEEHNVKCNSALQESQEALWHFNGVICNCRG